MVRSVFFWFLFLPSASAYLQDCDSSQWAQPGTYSVVIDSAAVESSESFSGPIMLSPNDLCFIESSRKPLEIAYIHLGAYLVTIYPKVKTIDNSIEE